MERENGVESSIRSMRYYRAQLREGSERFKRVTRAMKYFRRNIRRMNYADFIARGLPIGSGPVEAACKTIVNARLKRSGMRWTRKGGQNILNMRRHEKAGRWDALWQFYIEKRCEAA